MKHVGVSLRLFALTFVAFSGGALCARCEMEGATGGSTSSDGGVDAPADVPADVPADTEVWDPVWQETEPADWPAVGPEGQPDCGPGCRMALNVPVSHPGYFAYGYDPHTLGDTTDGEILYTSVGSSTSYIISRYSDGRTGLVQPYVNRGFIIYLASDYPKGVVELMRLSTGEVKRIFSYDNKDATLFTALNSKYAFWYQDGNRLMSRNLVTGEVRQLSSAVFSCKGICATESALICGQVADRVLRIDQETGDAVPLDDGGALQVNSNCSPDRRRVVWVDYRDPPGPGSMYDFHRNGGEIYMRDLDTGNTTRLTFDSPDSPVGKYGPAIDGDTVVWMEPCPTCDPNPESLQALKASTTLVRLDLATNKKCKMQKKRFGRLSLHGHHLYGYWFDLEADDMRLIDIDLDHPDIDWDCE